MFTFLFSFSLLFFVYSIFFFFFNDTATTEIYTLSLHDALPISGRDVAGGLPGVGQRDVVAVGKKDEIVNVEFLIGGKYSGSVGNEIDLLQRIQVAVGDDRVPGVLNVVRRP